MSKLPLRGGTWSAWENDEGSRVMLWKPINPISYVEVISGLLSGVWRMVSCHDFIVCWDFEVWSGFWGGWRGFWGLARGEESKPAWNQLDNQGIALWFVILGRSTSKFLYKIWLPSSDPGPIVTWPYPVPSWLQSIDWCCWGSTDVTLADEDGKK